MKISVKYAVTGALSGAANGFFGAGGGLFLVPLLISWCGMEQDCNFVCKKFKMTDFGHQ